MKTAVKPEGEGTEAKPYQITSLANLLWISHEAEKYNTNGKFYQMMNDIDASETRYWFDGTGFPPIGKNVSCAFQGTFDGNKKTITDLYINRASDSRSLCIGLFGYAIYATIKNLELKNFSMSAAADSLPVYAGGLVAVGFHSVIINCTTSGNVTGESIEDDVCLGGLVGKNFKGKIKQCTASVNVSGNSNFRACFGGLVGQNYEGTVTNCIADGAVTGSGRSEYFQVFVGGLVGRNYFGKIINGTATGTVTGTSSHYAASLGQLVGVNDFGSITKNTKKIVNVAQ